MTPNRVGTHRVVIPDGAPAPIRDPATSVLVIHGSRLSHLRCSAGMTTREVL
jgi:hypothetical protein